MNKRTTYPKKFFYWPLLAIFLFPLTIFAAEQKPTAISEMWEVEVDGKDQEAFETKLDSLFDIDIHIDEEHKLVDVTGLIGQYAHGNEPSHHITYLYNYTENPWKGQQRIRETCNTYYSHNVKNIGPY